MALSPDSRFLTASDTRTAAVWRFESAQLIQNVPGAWSTINSQGRWLTADKDGKLTSSEIGNAASGQDAGQLKPVPPAHLSPDGRWLIGADREKLVTLDLRTGTQKSLFDFDIAKRRIVMSRDGNLTALAPYFSNDRTVSLKTWNLKTGEFRTLSGPGAAHAVFSHDNRFLAAAADDKAVQVWDAATAQELKVFSLDQTVGSVSLNGTGQWLAASSYIGPTQIWEVESGRIVRSHPEKVFSFATFSPDSRWMARSIGSGITITDATTGQETHTVKGSLPLAFSNDTRLLATGAGTGIGQIQIWNVSTGEEVRTIKGDFQILREIKFSPDRRWLATRADDDEVTLWDLEGGKAPRAFSGYTMGFITGGSFFWVTGPDGITRFWSKEESKLVASLALIEHSDDWAVITPEGRFDGTTRGIQTLVAGRNGDRILSADQFMQRRMPGLLTSLFAR
jgi:WD40 repeat protein